MSSTRRAEDDWGELTTPLSFVGLMALERLGDTEQLHPGSNEPERIERFRSLAAPFPPGEGTRAFGGHVYAQSAYAASKTVGKGFVVHVSHPLGSVVGAAFNFDAHRANIDYRT